MAGRSKEGDVPVAAEIETASSPPTKDEEMSLGVTEVSEEPPAKPPLPVVPGITLESCLTSAFSTDATPMLAFLAKQRITSFASLQNQTQEDLLSLTRVLRTNVEKGSVDVPVLMIDRLYTELSPYVKQAEKKDENKDNKKDAAMPSSSFSKEELILVVDFIRLLQLTTDSDKEDESLQRLRERLKLFGLSERKTSPLGDCQFDAVADQLQIQGLMISSRSVRKAVVEWLEQHTTFLVEGCTLASYIHGKTFQQYCTDMKKQDTWGDHLTLFAAANLYSVDINIWSSVDDDNFICEIKPASSPKRSNPLLLAHISELHFISLGKGDDRSRESQNAEIADALYLIKRHQQVSYSATSLEDHFKAVSSPSSTPSPFVSHKVDFSTFSFGKVKAGDKENKVVQKYFTKHTPAINQLVASTAQSTLFDGNLKVTFGTRKPDHVMYKKGAPKEPFYITAFGDNKGARVAMQGFTAEEKGHLLDFAEDLFQVQRFRQFVYGFLTNGLVVQWFRFNFHRDSQTVKCVEFPSVLYNDVGLQSICDALVTDPSQLGWVLPVVELSGQKVELVMVLGHGAFSVVYLGVFKGEQVVVKHFPQNVTDPLKSVAAHRDTELAMLQKCRYVKNITMLKGLSTAKDALILTPVGIHFARNSKTVMGAIHKSNDNVLCEARDLRQLIDILRELHELGIVHRDIRLSNIFRYLNKVVLNDFGAAVQLTKYRNLVTFVGAKHHAPFHIREEMLKTEKYTYQPAFSDDLHMVVRTVFQCVNTAVYDGIVSSNNDAIEIALWKYHLNTPFWQNCLDYADHRCYDDLKHFISNILPK